MAMQTTSDNAEAEPMMEINTTPLIDVMLVLLIMLIITIPVQTHAVKLDLPVNQPNQAPPPIDPVKNVLSINAQDQVLWNGSPVTMTQLRSYLDTTQQMTRCPSFTFSRTRPRATRSSMRCSPSPRKPTSRKWASSATNII